MIFVLRVYLLIRVFVIGGYVISVFFYILFFFGVLQFLECSNKICGFFLSFFVYCSNL